MFSQ
ncbi:unnamed protein product [Timema podura]|jgi:hypothetical protein